MHDDAFAAVQGGAEEVYTSPAYFWDNSRREERNRFAFQRTLAGAAFFGDHAGRKLVPPGYIMAFTLREHSTYGYPQEATVPYRQRYLNFTATPSLQPLFTQLRNDYGSVLRMPEQSESGALFDELFARFRQRTFRDGFHESELLYRLLIALYREQSQEIHANDPIEFGFHYVRNNFRLPVNLKNVAAKCGVTREHFIREFSARYKEPPGTMLRRLRIDHASAMLAATKLSVEDVALASGFASANTFSRAYRLKFGRSPRGAA